MLVAKKDVFAGEPSIPGKMVGCIAVVRGTNSGVIFTEDSTEETFSVWKMSVAAEDRRNGKRILS